jgi:hypothetical protein
LVADAASPGELGLFLVALGRNLVDCIEISLGQEEDVVLCQLQSWILSLHQL